MDKIIFLTRIQHERDKFENLLNRVGFSRQMTMGGVWGNLSIKDLLVEILTREQFMADRLSEILHDERYSPCTSHSALEHFQTFHGYPDYESPLVEKDKINFAVIQKYKNIGLDDIIEQELAAYTNIISAFERLTHSQGLDHDLYHRTAEQTYKAYRRTSMKINRWLRSIAIESN